MTPRNRLLFNLLLGLHVAALPAMAPAARAAEPEVAPDQPGTGLRVLPPEAAKPKRRYTDRVTFHQSSPEAPVKPAKPADSPADPLAPREGVKAFDGRDFQAEAMHRPPPRPNLPTRDEIEQARDKRNWLKADSFQAETDRQDRDMLDQALGLRSDEELRAEEEQDRPEDDGLDRRRDEKAGDKPDFGDFFERMKERADALADVDFRDDAPHDPVDPNKQREKDELARDKADERRTGLAAGEHRTDEPRGFTPSVGSVAGAAPVTAEAPGSFSPSLATPAAGTVSTAGAASAPAAGRPAETYTFQRSNELMASLGTPGAGFRSAPPAGSSTFQGFATLPPPVGTGSFRSADGAFQRNEPLANLGGGAGLSAPPAAFRPPEPAFAAPAPRAAFSPAFSGESARGAFGTRPSDAPSTSARLALQAEPSPRLSSNFGGMKPLLGAPAPAAATLAPRSDRWERDRMQSQLMSDPASRPGARRATP